MQDKFNMTKKENIFFARKIISESIYHKARMERCNVTFPDTQTIISGVSVQGLHMHDVNVIVNLKNAWMYLLAHIDTKFDLNYMKELHKFTGYNEALEWGVFRSGSVSIGGVSYMPSKIVEDEVFEKSNEILKTENVYQRAIHHMLWSMRTQLFWDANKRTSILSANKILIENGKGVLVVKEEFLPEFNRRLSDFYETNDYSKIDMFIYDNCIFGLEK